MATFENTTNPSSSTMRGRVPATAIATTKLLPEAAVFPLIDDFEADDSGAMQHVIADEIDQRNFVPFYIKDLTCVVADDPHKAFLVAFKALISAPWPEGGRAQSSRA